MTFTPPAFKQLCPRTLNLEIMYSEKIRRFSIVPSSGTPADTQPAIAASSTDPCPSSSSSQVPYTSNLEILLARAHAVEECKTDRSSQRDVIVRVMNEARQALKEGDTNKINQATLFLMGTLLHRYFRLIKECSGYLSLGLKDPGNSDLFIAIRRAFNLPEYIPVAYRVNDLRILDVKTVLDCLHVFRENMFSIDEKTNLPKYRGYPHLNSDKNFETYLDEIISDHLPRGQKVLKQFKAIDYIKSLAKALEKQKEQVDTLLRYWIKDLKRDYPDFSQLNADTPEKSADKIEGHIDSHIKPGPEREMILNALYTPFIINKLSGMNHEQFISKLSKAYSDTASQILFAGYIPLLKSELVEKDLKFVILREVLGSDKIPAILTDKDMSNALVFFERFISDNPIIVLDLEFFGGSNKHVNLIKDVIEPLQQELTLNMQPHPAMAI